MLKDRAFLIWLALFAVVAGTLIALLMPRPSATPSIGGGGYDLSDWVYTWSLLLFTGLWSLIALMIGMSRNNPMAAKRAYRLAAIGGATFVGAAVAFGGNLH
ncbi:hypothetical protein [Achromobacter piechaudii]|uniref:Uncharacterized protein n=1 Tax=Achromobacter piechaudii TaxID=72556 RepID=A0A6S7ECZ0_9BURK|nr:hypothetical protein [Achromobacter piechaudii]CAB3904803.1 hypothetical protein LMG1861_04492 [Achromobacter piechaudii]